MSIEDKISDSFVVLIDNVGSGVVRFQGEKKVFSVSNRGFGVLKIEFIALFYIFITHQLNRCIFGEFAMF